MQSLGTGRVWMEFAENWEVTGVGGLPVGGGWESSINGVPGRFRVHWVHIPVQVVINAIHVRIICAFLRDYCFAAHHTQDDAELGCIRGRNK